MNPTENTFDVIIVGAGISGINAAYRLQESLPDYSYAILEGRSEMGGTWSLFKYPGIRSDSDLHTFGFPWDPWTEDRSIADAPSILKYIRTVSARHGIDKHIKYQHKVLKLNWKSDQQHYQIDVLVDGEHEKTFYARAVAMGTGYYNYNEGLNSSITGIESFKGTVVHPQFWPEDLDYTGKKVVIVGSGATAVTILPAMSEKAEKVTMLQRSPGWFVSIPQTEPIDNLIRRFVPTSWAYKLIRLRFICMGYLFFHFCRMFPNTAKKILRKETGKQLPKNIPLDPHFQPTYNPWQQRLCITPLGDFFAALRTGKADIATDQIDTVTETGIQLKSGQHIDADIIITATGLKMQIGGGSQLFVDNEPINVADKFIWRGVMLQDVPNLCIIFGYTNASWTLAADVTCQLFTRMLKHAKTKGMTSMVPVIANPNDVQQVPFLNLNSTYIKSAVERGVIPKAGNVGPWVPRSNWFVDRWNASWGDINTGMQFNRVTTN